MQVQTSEVMLASRTKRVYANAHTYHINSISVNSDQETFLSADDLRINLWNLEVRHWKHPTMGHTMQQTQCQPG